jgi:hypothetical protein
MCSMSIWRASMFTTICMGERFLKHGRRFLRLKLVFEVRVA